MHRPERLGGRRSRLWVPGAGRLQRRQQRLAGPQPGGHTVGGADPTGPKVMDAMTVVLP